MVEVVVLGVVVEQVLLVVLVEVVVVRVHQQLQDKHFLVVQEHQDKATVVVLVE
jgi:hypothetical protein